MRVLTESYRSTIFELMAALFVYLIQGHCADHFEIRCELGLFQLYTSEIKLACRKKMLSVQVEARMSRNLTSSPKLDDFYLLTTHNFVFDAFV